MSVTNLREVVERLRHLDVQFMHRSIIVQVLVDDGVNVVGMVTGTRRKNNITVSFRCSQRFKARAWRSAWYMLSEA